MFHFAFPSWTMRQRQEGWLAMLCLAAVLIPSPAEEPLSGEGAASIPPTSVPKPPPTNLVTVPRVTGFSPPNAHQALANAGLVLRHPLPKPPVGATVDAQNPGAGAKMQRGGIVQVTFAAPVPDVVGYHHNPAEQRLIAMTFRMDHAGDPSALATIRSQVPAAGTRLRLGSSVWVNFDDFVIVPDLAGLTLAGARERLQQAQLGLQPPGEVPPADVRIDGQTPASGERVRRGTLVSVRFATMLVPDVVAQSADSARDTVEKMGLKISWRTPTSSALSEYQVVAQEPAPGSKIAKGGTVYCTLRYASRTFGYRGNVLIDGGIVSELRANLQLKITGLKVTGTLEAPPVCEPNRRLPGGVIRDLRGTLSGPWEKEGTILWGNYTDGEVTGCPGSQPCTGLFTIWAASGNIYMSTTGLYYNNFFFGRLQGGPEFPVLAKGTTFPPPPKGKWGGGGPTVVKGKVWLSDGETQTPGADVRIIVGKNLVLRNSAGADSLENGTIAAETTTDANGNYQISLPAGKPFYILVWKRDYTPVQGSVTAPGVYNFELTKYGTLTTDIPHNSLDTTRLGSANPGGGGDSGMDDENGGDSEESTAVQLTEKEIIGPLSVSLPKDWIKRGDMPSGQGFWYQGDVNHPAASFAVLRLKTGQGLLRNLEVLQEDKIAIAGRAATRYLGRTKDAPPRQQILVIFTQAEAGGLRIALLADAYEERWAKYQPTFAQILEELSPAPSDRATVRPAGRIMAYPRVKDFRDDYRYTAYHDGIVLVHKATGKENILWADRPGHAVEGRFARTLEKDSVLAGRLGQAVTEETPLFDGQVAAQLFEGGAMLYEPASGMSWWNWHMKRKPGSLLTPSLPGDPATIVISLDYRGGFTLPRRSDAPHLVVYADRRVVVSDPFGGKAPLRDTVSARSFPDFLRFAIEEHDFFAIDSEELATAIRAAADRRGGVKITDAPTTVIRIRTQEQDHEVRCYALEQYAEMFPDILPLADLHAIERRLARFMEGMRAAAK